MEKLICKHPGKIDESHGQGVNRHWYCPDCGWHRWAGREYTRREWSEFIESIGLIAPKSWDVHLKDFSSDDWD